MAPRRLALDKVLLDAALAAGTELRQGVVQHRSRRGSRHRIRGRLQDGSIFTAHAKVVVGADGIHAWRGLLEQTPTTSSRDQVVQVLTISPGGTGRRGVLPRPERMIYAWDTNDGRSVIGIIELALRPCHQTCTHTSNPNWPHWRQAWPPALRG
jgi:2-polyprenyl-6-methoxyphenol hydroxylase-like FAD-dependent oxidoreductase